MKSKKNIDQKSHLASLLAEKYAELKSKSDVSMFLKELSDYAEFCKGLKASKKTHYQELEEWVKPAYDYIHDKLTHHGFINGGAAMGMEQPPMADLWWATYGLISSITHSPFLESEVAYHHSSAHSRNQALIKELGCALAEMK